MPQEAGTASLMVKRGAGVLLRRAADIVPVIRRMVEDTAHYSAMRAATIGLAIPNATRHIVEEITALIPASTEARGTSRACAEVAFPSELVPPTSSRSLTVLWFSEFNFLGKQYRYHESTLSESSCPLAIVEAGFLGDKSDCEPIA